LLWMNTWRATSKLVRTTSRRNQLWYPSSKMI
jgi:hypothetical protein